MITIFQADKNYKNSSTYDILKKNLEKLERNGNNYNFCVDDSGWVSYVDLKIIKLLDILKKYDDDEIIMYIDALDTSVEANDNEIEEKFLKFDTDVLYSSEKGIWPNPDFSKFFPDNFFINSGTIMFKNKKYQQILEALIEIAAGRLIYDCDQYYHTIFVMISLLNINIKIDKSNEIFQCLCNETESNFETVDNRIKNKTTNTFPCVFHGNGADGRKKIRNILGYYAPILSFLGFTEDRMGINFMNSSSLDNIQVYAEIKNIYNRIIYSNVLDLTYNISYFISAGIKDNYIFTIYDINKEILLQEKNFFKHQIKIVDSYFAWTKYSNTIATQKFNIDNIFLPESKYIEWNRSPINSNDNLVIYTDYSSGLVNKNIKTNICWLMEPEEIHSQTYKWIVNNNSNFKFVITHDRKLLDRKENYRFVPAGGCWISLNDQKIYEKNKMTSIIASDKDFTVGHRLRHEIISKFRDKMNVYGMGYNPVDYKLEALKDYMFSIIIENVKKDYWFTEKLIDSFVTGTVPIYWGCPSIGDFFNTDGMIIFDKIEDLPKILDELSIEKYLSMMSAIEDNFEKAKEYLIVEDYIYKNYLVNELDYNQQNQYLIAEDYIYENELEYESPISFLGFTEDKNGINYMNTSNENINVYAEITNTSQLIIYARYNLELSPNVKYFISSGFKDDYTFTIYDNTNADFSIAADGWNMSGDRQVLTHKNMLLQVRNY